MKADKLQIQIELEGIAAQLLALRLQFDAYANLYNELWAEADRYACDNLQGEELNYFYRTTN